MVNPRYTEKNYFLYTLCQPIKSTFLKVKESFEFAQRSILNERRNFPVKGDQWPTVYFQTGRYTFLVNNSFREFN